MANRTKLTPKKEEKFLEALRDCANVTTAAASIGVRRAYMYEYRAKPGKEAFSRRWDEAIEEGVDKLEREMWRRAVEGVDEPVFQNGRRVGLIRRYSDTLAIFLAKGHRPQKYKERRELSGDPDRPLRIDKSEMTDEELEAIIAKGTA
jgi:hypothetical protein